MTGSCTFLFFYLNTCQGGKLALEGGPPRKHDGIMHLFLYQSPGSRMTNLAPWVQTVAFPYLAYETSVLFATECVDTLLGTLVEQRPH